MYVELGVFIGVLVSSLVAAILITAAVTWTIFKKRHPPPPPPPPQKYREPTSQTYEPSPDVGVFQNPYFERNVGHRNNETVLNLDTISRDSSSFEQCSTTYENGFATYDLAEDVEIPDGQSGNQVHHERDNSSGFSPENKTNVYDLTETSSQSSNKTARNDGVVEDGSYMTFESNGDATSRSGVQDRNKSFHESAESLPPPSEELTLENPYQENIEDDSSKEYENICISLKKSPAPKPPPALPKNPPPLKAKPKHMTQDSSA
ncbi:unnamed protein product [Clavelina lepadiformis]|uniref:Uncharacterized protein n=1 Tax=Clavelina lepadiformis TaxID=159417 RepID=A0ABP0GZY0_CLALP